MFNLILSAVRTSLCINHVIGDGGQGRLNFSIYFEGEK